MKEKREEFYLTRDEDNSLCVKPVEVKEYVNKDMFLARNERGDWTIYEIHTGLEVWRGKTIKEVKSKIDMEAYQKAISKVGYKKMKANFNQALFIRRFFHDKQD